MFPFLQKLAYWLMYLAFVHVVHSVWFLKSSCQVAHGSYARIGCLLLWIQWQCFLWSMHFMFSFTLVVLTFWNVGFIKLLLGWVWLLLLMFHLNIVLSTLELDEYAKFYNQSSCIRKKYQFSYVGKTCFLLVNCRANSQWQ